ncbi:squalene/phytoene synthase family protein [Nocardioides sp. zg-1308]|uniref:Squalene/phytoene synthase family protein n=1 Tax=Nocardioides renjunii TaxID=3095075 RepID=A0ABU5KFE5_9ACTN|nr:MULTISPECIES: squalene/phytoene synthase family protein [unclassified Nocardioides]MDZ5663689.1 squalene/phytoene synthase family protein [Nocardioides sp. S-58]NPD06881.1 squalene/phytoene synthase family protein [Nocardioides sp. zg-1308]
MSMFVGRGTPRSLYDVVSEASSAVVIREYSSSFGLASRLLAEPVRTQVRNVYALVRVADEIVDNPDPTLAREARATMLDWLEDDVRHALRTGYSGNLVVHAFARTAIAVGIEDDVVAPFFSSMRTDLDTTRHTPESFERYVYGSAEVVGLMCLRAFLAAPDAPPDRGHQYDRLAPGARRLGAAFQKLNFVRDLSDDHDVLRRDYFPGLDVEAFCDRDRDLILDDIDADLRAAAAVVPDLPPSSRRAVRAAHATFAELATRLRAASADEIRRTRVRVPTAVKLRLAVGAIHGGRS